MSRPPSQAVIEAVERAEREHRWFEWCGDHFDSDFCCECGAHDTSPQHLRVEVARAAEIAALKVAADECEANARDWYGTDIFRDVDSADLAAVRSAMQAKGKDIDNLSAWYFRRVLTTRADILRRMADEWTDTDDRSK
jgi:hypothetical protein